MIDKGVKASWNPKMTQEAVRRGLDPRYMRRTRNIIAADAGSDTVVGVGLGLIVTTTKYMMGSKQKRKSIT